MSALPSFRPAYVEVNLDAVRANAALLTRLAGPARLCAVVKADGYGHGAAPIAAAALEGGATVLAVALVEEGIALRASGLEAEILLLSEPTFDAMAAAVEHRLTPTIYRLSGVEAVRAAAARLGRPVAVEVKLDSGMHRVGADEGTVVEVVEAIVAAPELVFAGLWTHFAVADVPDDPFTDLQLARLLRIRDELALRQIVPARLHAANSAGTIAHPASRLDLVRCGIALYGHLPSPALRGSVERALDGAALRPALSWRAAVHLVRPLAAGERTSYGRNYEVAHDGYVAVVPLGYHDGVPRRLATTGGEVLIGGRRRPIAGTVTMDQIIVDLGDDDGVRPGDEVVLIGRQGDEEVPVEEWAQRLGTIGYEVICQIGPRVPRRYRDLAAGVGPGATDGGGSRALDSAPGARAPSPAGGATGRR